MRIDQDVVTIRLGSAALLRAEAARAKTVSDQAVSSDERRRLIGWAMMLEREAMAIDAALSATALGRDGQ